ncbi:uncharacterized protein LOC144619050 [Crassostrea virginica]
MPASFFVLLLLGLATHGTSATLSDTVCRTSLWSGITESMITTSDPAARNVMNSRRDCCQSKREKGGWCGSAQGTENWIQVNFSQGAGVRAVVIQKPEDKHSGYVTSISVQFMLVGRSNWQYFSSDPTQPQEFSTLGDTVDTTEISLNPGVAVSKIKINILKHTKSPCLRFDLLGCTNYNELCPNSCLNGGQCLAENKCICSSSYTGNRCENLGKKLKKIIKTK